MKKVSILLAVITVITSTFFNSTVANASEKPLTIAVFGDWPYSITLLANAPLLINSVNSDPNVSLVIHVGDIHSGSMPCTGAGLNPIPVTANPGWNQGIYNIFQQFNDPLVYTPGDNEWIDCHNWQDSVLVFIRKAKDPRDYVIVCCNFTPVPRPAYKIGVPEACFFEEISNNRCRDSSQAIQARISNGCAICGKRYLDSVKGGLCDSKYSRFQ